MPPMNRFSIDFAAFIGRSRAKSGPMKAVEKCMTEQAFIVRRSFSGLFGPLSCAAGAIILLAASWYAATTIGHGFIRGEMKASDLLIAAAVCAIGAVALEVTIRRQLELARSGIRVDAIVDDVIPNTWGRDAITAEYHFFTVDGEWTDGKCH